MRLWRPTPIDNGKALKPMINVASKLELSMVQQPSITLKVTRDSWLATTCPVTLTQSTLL